MATGRRADRARGGAPVPHARPAELLAGRARHGVPPRPRPRGRPARDPPHGGDALRLLRRRLGVELGLRARRGRASARCPRSPAPPRSPSPTVRVLVLVSRRAGLVAAALVATNPFLVWYSQEARSYALLAFLGAGSVLAFGLALRGDARRRSRAGRPSPRSRSRPTTTPSSWSRRRPCGCSCVSGRGGPPSSHRTSRRPLLLAQVPLVLAQRGNGEAVAGSSLVVRDRRDPEEPRRRVQLPGRGARERARRAAPRPRSRSRRPPRPAASVAVRSSQARSPSPSS